MNQGAFLRIVRASTWAGKYVMVREEKFPSEGKT